MYAYAFLLKNPQLLDICMDKNPPKRVTCAHCRRRRRAKFMEWHETISVWQCRDFCECDDHRGAERPLQFGGLDGFGGLGRLSGFGWIKGFN